MALEIKDGNFEELLASGKPLVVDFWATWCGPCKKIAPDVEALAEQYKDQVIIGKCDVDDNDEVDLLDAVLMIQKLNGTIGPDQGAAFQREFAVQPRSIYPVPSSTKTLRHTLSTSPHWAEERVILSPSQTRRETSR